MMAERLIVEEMHSVLVLGSWSKLTTMAAVFVFMILTS